MEPISKVNQLVMQGAMIGIVVGACVGMREPVSSRSMNIDLAEGTERVFLPVLLHRVDFQEIPGAPTGVVVAPSATVLPSEAPSPTVSTASPVPTRKFIAAGCVITATNDIYIDGSIDTIEVQEYDGVSRMRAYTVTDVISGGISEIHAWNYLADRTVYVFDEQPIGSPDIIITDHLHRDQRRAKTETDYGADGGIDDVKWYEYTQQPRIERILWDQLADLTIDRVQTFTYDEDLLIRIDTDDNADESIDASAEYMWQNRLLALEKHSYRGKLNRRIEYRYNAGGLEVESKAFDGNGELNSVVGHEYDERGLLTETREYEPPGEIEQRISYVYDNLDRVITQTARGHTLSFRIEREYECIQ